MLREVSGEELVKMSPSDELTEDKSRCIVGSKNELIQHFTDAVNAHECAENGELCAIFICFNYP